MIPVFRSQFPCNAEQAQCLSPCYLADMVSSLFSKSIPGYQQQGLIDPEEWVNFAEIFFAVNR
jgi:hypothetical protein